MGCHVLQSHAGDAEVETDLFENTRRYEHELEQLRLHCFPVKNSLDEEDHDRHTDKLLVSGGLSNGHVVAVGEVVLDRSAAAAAVPPEPAGSSPPPDWAGARPPNPG